MKIKTAVFALGAALLASTSAFAQQVVTLKMANWVPPTHHLFESYNKLADQVSKLTNGTLKIEVDSTAVANPGGMWMPRQMAEQAKLLADLGLEIDATRLSDLTAAPLSAVVSLGGCTGSFVSAEGLVITNHHCVQGALQLNSTPETNLVETGFLAATRADEKPAGATQRIPCVVPLRLSEWEMKKYPPGTR